MLEAMNVSLSWDPAKSTAQRHEASQAEKWLVAISDATHVLLLPLLLAVGSSQTLTKQGKAHEFALGDQTCKHSMPSTACPAQHAQHSVPAD